MYVSFTQNTSRYTIQSPRPFGPSASGSGPIFRAWGSNWTTWPSTTCLTKTARRTDMQLCLIPPSDFKPIIRKHITVMWQSTWDESPLNKLHEITPIVNEPCTHHLSTRRDQSVFNRCRIGHSRLTHEFLLKGDPSPECIPCNCPLTTKHLLTQRVDFNEVRQRFYQVPSLQDLFKTVKPEVI